MTTAATRHGSLSRTLAVLAALTAALALLPPAGPARAQTPACPDNVAAAPFSDRAAISTAHRANVDCAAHNGIVEGFGDNTYRPRVQVRRDQMASFIARTLGAAGVVLPAPGATFSDVPSSNPHADAVHRLRAAGVITGAPAGLGPDAYGPALQTRRDQMASFIIRALEFAADQQIGSDNQQFSDVPPGNTHFQNVNAAAILALAQGVSDTQFAPGQSTLRDQMASFVVRLLRFLVAAIDGPELELALPAGCEVDGQLTATATLTIEGDLVAGEEIAFATTGVATTPDEGTAQTDADGEATFTFTVEEAGMLTVTAGFTGGEQTATTSAQLPCGVDGSADAGVVVGVDVSADAYTYDPDSGGDAVTVEYDVAEDTFSVDGGSVTATGFESNLSVGDRITVTTTDGATHHALVNADDTVEGVATETLTPGGSADGGTLQVLPTGSATRQTVTYGAGTTFTVNGAASSEAQFESTVKAGDDVTFTPAPTGGEAAITLVSQTLAGVPGDIDTAASTYDVENAAGGVIYDDLDYTATIYGGLLDRYFVDGGEVLTSGPFETALQACAAAPTNPCTIEVTGGLLSTEHRLTTS